MHSIISNMETNQKFSSHIIPSLPHLFVFDRLVRCLKPGTLLALNFSSHTNYRKFLSRAKMSPIQIIDNFVWEFFIIETQVQLKPGTQLALNFSSHTNYRNILYQLKWIPYKWSITCMGILSRLKFSANSVT